MPNKEVNEILTDNIIDKLKEKTNDLEKKMGIVLEIIQPKDIDLHMNMREKIANLENKMILTDDILIGHMNGLEGVLHDIRIMMICKEESEVYKKAFSRLLNTKLNSLEKKECLKKNKKKGSGSEKMDEEIATLKQKNSSRVKSLPTDSKPPKPMPNEFALIRKPWENEPREPKLSEHYLFCAFLENFCKENLSPDDKCKKECRDEFIELIKKDSVGEKESDSDLVGGVHSKRKPKDISDNSKLPVPKYIREADGAKLIKEPRKDEDYNEWLRSVKETLKEGGYELVNQKDLQNPYNELIKDLDYWIDINKEGISTLEVLNDLKSKYKKKQKEYKNEYKKDS